MLQRLVRHLHRLTGGHSEDNLRVEIIHHKTVKPFVDRPYLVAVSMYALLKLMRLLAPAKFTIISYMFMISG